MKTTIVCAIFILSRALNCTAQKLPNKQTISLRAPSNIKIDGKASEWGNKFEAYNSATNIFYTICNDDEKLYLTVKATDPGIINKILGGGVALNIIASGNKKDKNGVIITFPARDSGELPLYLSHKEIPGLLKDTTKNRNKLDSMSKVLNKRVADNIKLIGISGIKEIPDNLISMYNDIDIKAVALFDDKISYTYELSVPLKYLGLDINQKAKFIYQIKLNGTLSANATTSMSESGRFIIVEEPGKKMTAIPNIPLYSAGAYVTDFWGKYSLSK